MVFMGHVLSKNGIGAAHSKLKAVTDTQQPTNATEVRNFLGLVNYCVHFIPNLATLAESLRRLTRSSCTWSWNEEQELEQESTFNALKCALASSSSSEWK